MAAGGAVVEEVGMHVVVVGAGLAGGRAVEELRAAGHTGEVTLIGAEPHSPYERPPLSKDVLLGRADVASATLFDDAWYAEAQVDLRVATEAVGVDLARGVVELVDGSRLAYDRLLLATGCEPVRLAVAEAGRAPGSLPVPVTHLRTVEDAEAIRSLWSGGADGRRLLVVGGGWIGLEVAAAARENGMEVTLVHRGAQPLGRVLGPEMGQLFAAVHREHGVDLRLGATLEELTAGPAGRAAARLSDGSSVHVDAVVVGVGVRPRTRLAEAAGLPTDDGVLVDATLRTGDPHVWAAGDVACHEHPVLRRRVRVDHWDAAQEQGRHAARAMLGDPAPYTRLPYFYTDQYDLGMEYVGFVGREGYDDVVVEGDVPGRVLTARYVTEGTVVAALQINDWDAMDGLRETVGRPLRR
ncbi:NAD(P)/FAD-dependent oxidoreductase [Ornithinimicrobium cerasi]|nr:FAD/NAD(P)-binding oxidoreductase [Ornithinimicrobium cerasi]